MEDLMVKCQDFVESYFEDGCREGEFLSFVIARKDDGEVFKIVLEFENEEQKKGIIYAVMAHFILQDVKEYVFCSETWAVLRREPKMECQPRDHPDREDQIVLLGRSICEEELHTVYYKIDKNRKLSPPEIQKTSEYGGYFSRLLIPYDKRPENFREMARKFLEKSPYNFEKFTPQDEHHSP